MCYKCSSGQGHYGHGVKVGQKREANDRNPSRAAKDPYYGGRSSYGSGRSKSYSDGVKKCRSNVRSGGRKGSGK